MRLDCPRKYINNSYPQEHPILEFVCENHEEVNNLVQKINSLFSPLIQSQKVDYDYQLNGKKILLQIGDQTTENAVQAVQQAKKDLEDWVYEYDFPWWLKALTVILMLSTTFLLFVLGRLTTQIIAILKRINQMLKSRFGLSNIQSISIIAGVIVLITIVGFWVVVNI